MELTRKEIEDCANATEGETRGLSINPVYHYDLVRRLSKQLLSEMDKPKVWDNAPEWATKAIVKWSAPTHYSGVYKEYTRELQKSRARQIADQYNDLRYIDRQGIPRNVSDAIEAAILKYAKENK